MINAMAESNAHDTSEVATQAGTINDMVNEMTKLFKQDEDQLNLLKSKIIQKTIKNIL